MRSQRASEENSLDADDYSVRLWRVRISDSIDTYLRSTHQVGKVASNTDMVSPSSIRLAKIDLRNLEALGEEVAR